jgi:hypothetical protein
MIHLVFQPKAEVILFISGASLAASEPEKCTHFCFVSGKKIIFSWFNNIYLQET